jgi:uncharacterized protein
MTFSVYQDSGGNYRWRLTGGNGQTVAASGESFASRSNATRAADGFKANAKAYTFEVYADRVGKYRWRSKASNGERVATSGESFATRSNAQRAADNVQANVGSAAGP